MNIHENIHWKHRSRFTVSQRRAMLKWSIIGVCVGIFGLLEWCRRH